MRTIIMTKGLPASGKSTWAKAELAKHPRRYKRLNKDTLRAMMDGEAWSQSQERFMLDIRDYAVQRALLRDFDVIVDDTNFSDKHWESMCRIAKRVGDVTVVEKYFDVDLNEALRRNDGRTGTEKVPEDVIRNMHRNYVLGKHIECRTKYFPIEPYKAPVDGSLPKAIIVDIDGTLALSRGIRNPYDGSRLMEDIAFDHVVHLVRLLKADGHMVIFMSGREDKWLEDTRLWLSGVAILESDGPFFMRATGDSRPDTIVKRELYEAHVAGKYDVRYVLDDRPSVCAGWRDLGLVVLQLDDRPF